jgi:hypothetical protein
VEIRVNEKLETLQDNHEGDHNGTAVRKHFAPNNKKLKQSRYRTGVAQRVPGVLGSKIFMTFGTRRW